MQRPLCLVLLCALGCSGTTPTQKSQEQSSQNKQEADPSAALKAVREKGLAKARAGSWTIPDTTFDVRKTDSLVSPFVGEISFTGSAQDPKYTDPLEREIRMEYAYQNGAWVLSKVHWRPTTPNAKWLVSTPPISSNSLVTWKELVDAFTP
ncbi:MAG: hypothetical protein FJ304_18655 [Planctomycetes bacterium]|nr:hypothetical protein [Planctomycetota bacterium]